MKAQAVVEQAVVPKLLHPDGRIEEYPPKHGKQFTYPELVEAIGGGYIEIIPVPSQNDARMIIDEDGKRKGLPFNPIATEVARAYIRPDDVIVGPALLCLRAQLN